MRLFRLPTYDNTVPEKTMSDYWADALTHLSNKDCDECDCNSCSDGSQTSSSPALQLSATAPSASDQSAATSGQDTPAGTYTCQMCGHTATR